MKLDNFIAWVQAILSAIYIVCTFVVIIIYELGFSKLGTPGQEKTFDSMVSWMTGGALIVLYFWLQRARAAGIPDPATTTTTETVQRVTTPTPQEIPNATNPPTILPAVPAAGT